jgi:S1-C subfamily serine protease
MPQKEIPRKNIPPEDIPPAERTAPAARSSCRLAWACCLALAVALGLTIWQAWREAARTAAEQTPEIAALDADIARQEAGLQELRALLEADPCSVPESALDPDFAAPLVLPDVSGAARPPRAEAEKEPDNPDASSSASSGQSSGRAAQPAAGEGFTADNATIEAATVLVLTEENMGTGFFVAPAVLATNRHVVEKAASGLVVINKALGRPVPARVIAMSQNEERDYAIIRIEGAPSLPAPLPLCGSVAKTERVGAWGFPGVLSRADPAFQALIGGDMRAVPENVYSEGVVNVIYATTPPVIMHTADISPGNSGGPLVNAEGCVVGINTMIRMDKASYRQTGISLTSNDLADFLRQNGVMPRYTRGK